MKPLFRSRRWLVAALLLVIGSSAAFFVSRYPEFRKSWTERANVAAAKRHIPVVMAALGEDGRYVGVTFHPSSAAGGSLLVSGIVASGEDLATLKSTVSGSGVPVPVKYQVSVLSPRLKKKLENAP